MVESVSGAGVQKPQDFKSANPKHQTTTPLNIQPNLLDCLSVPELFRGIVSLNSADEVIALREAYPKNTDLLRSIDTLNYEDRAKLSNHPEATVDLYKPEGELRSVKNDLQTRVSMVGSENLSPELLSRYTKTKHPDLLRALSLSASLTKPNDQRAIADTNQVSLLAGLAMNTSVKDPVIHQRLAKSQLLVQELLAQNTALEDPEAQKLLAKVDNEHVQLLLVDNISVNNDEVNNILANSRFTDVRAFLSAKQSAGQNNSTPTIDQDTPTVPKDQTTPSDSHAQKIEQIQARVDKRKEWLAKTEKTRTALIQAIGVYAQVKQQEPEHIKLARKEQGDAPMGDLLVRYQQEKSDIGKLEMLSSYTLKAFNEGYDVGGGALNDIIRGAGMRAMCINTRDISNWVAKQRSAMAQTE